MPQTASTPSAAKPAVNGLRYALERQILDRANSASDVSLVLYVTPLNRGDGTLFFQVQRNTLLDKSWHMTRKVGGGSPVNLRCEEDLRFILKHLFADQLRSYDDALHLVYRQGAVGGALLSSLVELEQARQRDP